MKPLRKRQGIRTALASCALAFIVAVAALGVMPSAALAQSWNERQAHDKNCRGNTRIWHARCELANGGWSHACPNSGFQTFKGLPVERQGRLPDRAWTEVATRDPSCGWPTPARWADERAHDKGCAGSTHLWHVRCESSAGAQTSCADRADNRFRGAHVFRQLRLPDRAWSAVATQDTACGWSDSFDDDKALMERSLHILDIALGVREGKYDNVIGQVDGWNKGVQRYTNPTMSFVTDDDGNTVLDPDSDIRPQRLFETRFVSGLSAMTVYRRHSRHNMNFVILSDAGTVFVAFWGTVQSENLPANFRLVPVVNPAYKNVWTHPGYAGVAFDVWQDVKAEIAAQGGATKNVVFTGHSMGGGVAGHLMWLALQDGVLPSDRRHRLITFGTPRYGTQSLRREFESMVRSGPKDTKAWDVEITEDGQVTSAFASLADAQMGTRINLPAAIFDPTITNHHSHLSYLALIRAL